MLVGTIRTFHINEIRTTEATSHLVLSLNAKPTVKSESNETKLLQLTSKMAVLCTMIHTSHEKYGIPVSLLLKFKLKANTRDA